jgi:D-xylulose reductase
LALIASGQVDVKPFISRTFAFENGVQAFEEAAAGRATDVKIQIEFPAVA